MALTDEQIEERAQTLAHENSAACRNRAPIFQNGAHGMSCKRLADDIAKAMRDARDASSNATNSPAAKQSGAKNG